MTEFNSDPRHEIGLRLAVRRVVKVDSSMCLLDPNSIVCIPIVDRLFLTPLLTNCHGSA